MAFRPEKTTAKGKRVYPAARRDQQATPRTTLGKGKQSLRVRRPKRKRNPGRSFWRQEPAHYLSLHVWPGMGRRLPELFHDRRPPGRKRGASGEPRCEAG